jgi:hypothetical protein
MRTFLTVLSLSFAVLAARLNADDLKASDLARALGVDWWTIEVPKSSADTVSLGFCVVFPDGRKQMSGFMGGFRPGARVLAFCWPSTKPDMLNVSLVSDTGKMTTTLPDPFGSSRVSTYPVPFGGTSKTGEVLRKGSTSNSVQINQALKEGESGLMVVQQE